MKVKPNFICKIDTIEVKSSTFLDIDKSDRRFKCITKVRYLYSKDGIKYYGYRIDPSKLSIFSLNSLQYCIKTLIEFLYIIKMEKPSISRIDFCFNEYNHYYEELSKINHLMFILLAKEYKFNNNYVSEDLDSTKGKSTIIKQKWKIKDRMLEAEFYDKSLESINSNVLCRLEFRSKPLNIPLDYSFDVQDVQQLCEESIKYEFLSWLEKVNKVANTKYTDMNKSLFEINDRLVTEDAVLIENKVHTKMDFGCMIQINHRRIFTRRQLGDLLKKAGIWSSESRATKYIADHPGIELYKPSDLKEYVAEITRAANNFMGTHFFHSYENL